MKPVTSSEIASGPSRSEEKELVSGCMRADSTAWETIMRHHGPRIASQVRRYASLRGEVEDIKQEVFLKVFCNLQNVRLDEGNLGGWISRIARNLIVDHLRRRTPLWDTFGSERLEELASADDGKPNPESAAIRHEASRQLRKSMRCLSRDLAEVLTLRYVTEMNYREIAEALQLPSGTVKSRLKRARDQLAVRNAPTAFCQRGLTW